MAIVKRSRPGIVVDTKVGIISRPETDRKVQVYRRCWSGFPARVSVIVVGEKVGRGEAANHSIDHHVWL